MIHSFKYRLTEAVFNSRPLPRFRRFELVARRKLLQLHSSPDLDSLRIPPGHRLEALTRDRVGQHCIRINDQWRTCFVWKDGAHDVENVDDH